MSLPDLTTATALSLPAPSLSYEDAIETFDVRGLRAAWSLDLGFAAVDPEVAELTEAAGPRARRGRRA